MFSQNGNRYVTYHNIPEGIAAVCSTETLAKGAQGRGGTCTFSFGSNEPGGAGGAEAKAGGAAKCMCDIPHDTAPVHHIPGGIGAGCSTETGATGATVRAVTGTPPFGLTKSGGGTAVGAKAGWPAKRGYVTCHQTQRGHRQPTWLRSCTVRGDFGGSPKVEPTSMHFGSH
jgi:hypothetical protein